MLNNLFRDVTERRVGYKVVLPTGESAIETSETIELDLLSDFIRFVLVVLMEQTSSSSILYGVEQEVSNDSTSACF